jgi:CMP-2-keto-3-deoxyoctulosonic acid synthetase
LEDAEKLEQLRFMYWGHRIRLAETEYRTMGVDVPEDISKAEEAMKAQEASDLFQSMHHQSSPMREEG